MTDTTHTEPDQAERSSRSGDAEVVEHADQASWRAKFTVVREFACRAELSAFYRAVGRGDFVSVARGVYLESDLWHALDRHDRYRTLIKAAAITDQSAVFSHHSAAALWRLPWVGDWPRRVHAVVPPRAGGCSTSLVIRHTTGNQESPATIDGLAVTPLARTVVDVASVATFEQSVAAADAALRRTAHPLSDIPRTFLTREDLEGELDRIPLTHGARKAWEVIEFSNGLADRPGESVSRVSMFRARLPMPELQVELAGVSGRIWHVDFWWPPSNLIGEFDGKWKYTDPEFRRGRTSAQVLLDEKDREDDLRAAGHGFARWAWSVAVSPAKLRDRLRAAGLR